MVRRSSRVRKPVTPFEDKTSTPASISASVEDNAKSSAKSRVKKPLQIKKESPGPATAQPVLARKALSRPRKGRPVKRRQSSPSKTHGALSAAKRRRLRSPPAVDGSDPLSSSPIPGIGDVHLDSDSDFDDDSGDDNDNQEEEIPSIELRQQPGPVTPRRAAKFGLTQRGNLVTESEPVIEQWYADPYERVDPNGLAYDMWRRKNLVESLQNSGFSLVRAKTLATWLIRCNGRYQDFEETKNSGSRRFGQVRNRKRNGRKTGSKPKPPSLDLKAQSSNPDLQAEQKMLTEVNLNLQQVNNRYNEGDEEEEEESDEDSESSDIRISTQDTPQRQRLSTNVQQPGTFFKTINDDRNLSRLASSNAWRLQTPSSTDRTEDGKVDERAAYKDDEAAQQEVIAKLKRALKLFKLVYGEDLPDPDYVGYEILHTASITNLPRAVPRQGLRTQGHGPLRQAILEENNVALTNHINEPEPGIVQARPHGREVLTEDDEFGLTLFLPKDTCSYADLATYNQERRLALERQKFAEPASELVSTGQVVQATDGKTTSHVSVGHTKTNDTEDSDPRANAKVEAEKLREQVVEQLKEQVFSWETEQMIQKAQHGLIDTDSYAMYEGETITPQNVGSSQVDDPAWPGHVKKTLHSWRTIKYEREDRARKLAAGGALAEEVYAQDREAARKDKIRLQSYTWRENAKARKRAMSMNQAGMVEEEDGGMLQNDGKA